LKKGFIIGLLILVLAPKLWAKGHINISAQAIKRYPQEHLVVAQGHVEITYEDVKPEASKVRIQISIS